MAEIQLEFDETTLQQSNPSLYGLYIQLYNNIEAASKYELPDYMENPLLTEDGEIDIAAITAAISSQNQVLMKNSAYKMASAIVSSVGGGGGEAPNINLADYATIKYVDDEIGKVTKQGLLFDIYGKWEAVLQKIFPLNITLSASSTISEYTETAKTFNLTWTCKREGANITPSNVKITQDGNTIYDEKPSSSSGSVSVSVSKKGSTSFKAIITAEGISKDATASHSRVLPIFYGFSLKDITLENMKDSLNKEIASSFNVTKTIANSVEGGHLVIALPDNKKINTIKSGGFDVPMASVITDTYKVGNTDYSYNIYYSSNPINLGDMTIDVTTK